MKKANKVKDVPLVFHFIRQNTRESEITFSLGRLAFCREKEVPEKQNIPGYPEDRQAHGSLDNYFKHLLCFDSVHVGEFVQVPVESRGVRSPEARVTGS